MSETPPPALQKVTMVPTSGDGDIRITRLEERLSASERAREVALSALDRRLEGMNEFRETLREQQNTFIRQDRYQAEHDAVVRELAIMRDELSSLRIRVETGSAAMVGRWLGYASLGAVFVTVVAGLLVHLLDGLTK